MNQATTKQADISAGARRSTNSAPERRLYRQRYIHRQKTASHYRTLQDQRQKSQQELQQRLKPMPPNIGIETAEQRKQVTVVIPLFAECPARPCTPADDSDNDEYYGVASGVAARVTSSWPTVERHRPQTSRTPSPSPQPLQPRSGNVHSQGAIYSLRRSSRLVGLAYNRPAPRRHFESFSSEESLDSPCVTPRPIRVFCSSAPTPSPSRLHSSSSSSSARRRQCLAVAHSAERKLAYSGLNMKTIHAKQRLLGESRGMSYARVTTTSAARDDVGERYSEWAPLRPSHFIMHPPIAPPMSSPAMTGGDKVSDEMRDREEKVASAVALSMYERKPELLSLSYRNNDCVATNFDLISDIAASAECRDVHHLSQAMRRMLLMGDKSLGDDIRWQLKGRYKTLHQRSKVEQKNELLNTRRLIGLTECF